MARKQRRMTFGIQPTGWTNDDFPEIGNDLPYQVILDETRKSGFAGGSTGHNYPAHLPSLLHAVSSRGLGIASTWAGTSFSTGTNIDAAFADFRNSVAFLKEVGARDVVVAELAGAVNQVRGKSVLTERPTLTGAQWYLLAESLNQAGEIAAQQGMQLSYHPHVGTVVMTVDETERLFESTHPEHVGFCIDTAHLRYGGATEQQIVDLTRKYVRRIKHVHLKDVRRDVLPVAVREDYSFYQAIRAGIFTVPGDPGGDPDYLREVLALLREAGYDRWMVIEAEQDPTAADPSTGERTTPLQYAETARRFLTKELGY